MPISAVPRFSPAGGLPVYHPTTRVADFRYPLSFARKVLCTYTKIGCQWLRVTRGNNLGCANNVGTFARSMYAGYPCIRYSLHHNKMQRFEAKGIAGVGSANCKEVNCRGRIQNR